MRLHEYERLNYAEGKLEGAAAGCEERICQAVMDAAIIIDQILTANKDKVLPKEKNSRKMSNGDKFTEVFGPMGRFHFKVLDMDGKDITAVWFVAGYRGPEE